MVGWRPLLKGFSHGIRRFSYWPPLATGQLKKKISLTRSLGRGELLWACKRPGLVAGCVCLQTCNVGQQPFQAAGPTSKSSLCVCVCVSSRPKWRYALSVSTDARPGCRRNPHARERPLSPPPRSRGPATYPVPRIDSTPGGRKSRPVGGSTRRAWLYRARCLPARFSAAMPPVRSRLVATHTHGSIHPQTTPPKAVRIQAVPGVHPHD